LLPNPGSGVAVNVEKRHTDIAYLVTDEGYPPKITHFCRHWPDNQEMTTEMRRQALADKANSPAN
jgi:hypothetical protein